MRYAGTTGPKTDWRDPVEYIGRCEHSVFEHQWVGGANSDLKLEDAGLEHVG